MPTAAMPHARDRQRLLLDVMARRRLDAVVLGRPEHVYWATGHRVGHRQHEAAFLLRADGHATLFPANGPDPTAAVDEQVPFEANWNGTVRQEQPRVVAQLVHDRLKSGPVAADSSAITASFDTPVDFLDDDLYQLRRSKWPDEMALVRKSVDCLAAMYARARQIIAPGLAELEMYNQLLAAAVDVAGEPWTRVVGNDFACGAAGGPPRAGHAASAGQLWVLDLGPVYRGYNADACRAYAVDRKPTEAQQRTFDALLGVFPIVEPMMRPGARCRDLYAAADEHLRATLGKGQPHHLGHGVGLSPHEYPHLNDKWDDVLLAGDVFTVEPGAYGPEVNIRLEHQYVVTADGAENLTAGVPIELVP